MKRLTIALITILCMGSSLPVLKQDIRNSSGTGLSGALMYFYEAGTSTPYDTWSDEALTSANANPVVADGNGFFGEIYLDPDQTYKVVVKTSSGSMIYSVDNINAVQLTSSSLAARLKQVASNPIDWGAAGDGTTDDCAGDNDIQQAIDNATGVVDLLGLTYRCDSSISLASGITLKNGTIDFSNSSDEELIDISGTIGSGVDLSSNAAAGDTTIAVDSASGLAVGDWLLLYSSDLTNGGEIVLITAISGTTLTLDRPLFGAYNTVNTAQIKKITVADNILVENVKVLHSESASGTPSVFLLDNCADVTLRNVHVDTFSDTAIDIRSCANVVVDNATIENGDSAGASYGITLCDGARDTLITNSWVTDVKTAGVSTCYSSTREGFVTNTTVRDSYIDNTAVGSAVKFGSRSYSSIADGNIVGSGLGVTGTSIVGSKNVFRNNEITDSTTCISIIDAVEVIGNRCSGGGATSVDADSNTSLVVADNSLPGTAILDASGATYLTVTGNTIAWATYITVGTSTTTVADNSIGDFTIITGGSACQLAVSGNSISTASATLDALTITTASCDVTVTGNTVESSTTGGEMVISASNVAISNNYVTVGNTTGSGLLVSNASDVIITGNYFGDNVDLNPASGGALNFSDNTVDGDIDLDAGGYLNAVFTGNRVVNSTKTFDAYMYGNLIVDGNFFDGGDAATNLNLIASDFGFYVTMSDNILVDGTYGVTIGSDSFISNGNQFLSMATGDITGEVPDAIHYYGSASTPTGSSDQPGTGGDTNWHEMTGCANGDADLKGFTESDCDLVSTYGGTYLIGYSASFSGHNTESYVFGVSMGNPADVVPETGCYSTIYLDSANDFNIAGNCILAPSAGDTLRLITKSVGGGATEMSVDSLTFTATQL